MAQLDYAQLLNNPELLKKLQAQVSEADTPEQPPVTAMAIRPDMSEADIKKQLYMMLGQSMQQQSAQVEALKAQAEQERKRQEQIGSLGRLDIRPFAQAARGYGATNVAIPTEAPEDRTGILQKLQQSVSEAQQGLTKEQVNALRNMMEDRQRANQLAQDKRSEQNFALRLRSTINTSEEAKKIRNIGTLNQKLSNLEKLVEKTGAELTGKEKAALDSAFKDAEVAWKEAANLGALTGPDVGMIQGALGQSPTSLMGIGRYAISGGKAGLMAKIRGARQRAAAEGKGHLESLQSVFPYEQAAPIYQDLSKKVEIEESEADKIRKELKALKESK